MIKGSNRSKRSFDLLLPLKVTQTHVLLVEDNPQLAEAFVTMLRMQGYRVSHAASVASACAIQEAADVLILDITLPDGEGLSLPALLAAAGRSPRRMIALTGHDDDVTRRRCAAAGCREIMIKPVSMRDLAQRIGSPPDSDTAGNA
jgi:DNA-binding response OmpR family regulator